MSKEKLRIIFWGGNHKNTLFIRLRNLIAKDSIHTKNRIKSLLVFMVWKYRECLPDVPLARDIPKIGKFKATNSLRVSCLLEFARHGHNLMGVSPHRSLISASVQPTAMVSVVIRHLKEVLGKALT